MSAGLAPAGMAASLAAREPDQRMSARSLCRSHLDCHYAGKSVAPVVCLNGLCVAVCLAPHRPASHAVRQSDLRHHPSQAAQDRRPRTRECTPHQGCDGVSVSRSRYLGLGCQASRRCSQRARLARLTRAAATRNPRGITPRPTETTSSPPLRLRKRLLPLASPDANPVRLHTSKQTSSQNRQIIQRYGEKSGLAAGGFEAASSTRLSRRRRRDRHQRSGPR